MSRGKNKARFRRLQDAVITLYSAAMWLPDREVPNEAELWENLRDAAGLSRGTKMSLLVQGPQAADEER